MERLEPQNYMRALTEALARTEFTDREGRALGSEDGYERLESLIADYLPGAQFRQGKVLLIGNGGSAAIASHVHNDFSKGLGVRALVFNEAPLLTALANDLEYNAAFEHNAKLWSEAGDLTVAISSSGRSGNILRAVKAARARGCRVVTLSGFAADNPLRRLGDINLYVPSASYGHVEVAHLALLHSLTDRLLARRAVEIDGLAAQSEISISRNDE